MMTDTQDRFVQWGQTGAYQGAKLGFTLASKYMLVSTLFLAGLLALNLIGSAIGDGNPELLLGILAGLAFLLFVWFFGFFVGILPATVLGMVVGAIVGLTTALPTVYNSSVLRRVVGPGMVLLLALIVAGSLFEAMGADTADGAWHMGSWYFVGVPFLFCIGSMVWLSDRLPTLSPTPMPYETIAKERPVSPPLWLD